MALRLSLWPHIGHSLQATSRCRWAAPRASTTPLCFPPRWPPSPSSPVLLRLLQTKPPTKQVLKKVPAPPSSPISDAPRPVPTKPVSARPAAAGLEPTKPVAAALPKPMLTAKPTARPGAVAGARPSAARNAAAMVGNSVQAKPEMASRRVAVPAPLPPGSRASIAAEKAAAHMFAEMLASKDHPTELYHASPALKRMMWTGWVAAGFCAGYFGLNYWSMVVYPPEGVNAMVPVMFGVICTFMGGAAFWFATGTRGVVWSIRTWPAVATKNSAQIALSKSVFRKGLYRKIIKTADRAIAAKKPVFIEVFILQGVPLMPHARMMVLPEEVQMPFRMQALIQAGKIWRAENSGTMAVQMLDAGDGLTVENHSPLHVFRMWFYNFWHATKRALVRGGFVKVDIGNVICKFDITAARALDDGKAMDQLLGIAPAQKQFPI